MKNKEEPIKKEMIKAVLNIDTEELEERITQKVVASLKLLLKGRGDEDIIFDVEGLAEYLKTSKRWIYEQTHLSAIPFYKVNRYPKFRKSEIDKWLEKAKSPAVSALSRPLQVVK